MKQCEPFELLCYCSDDDGEVYEVPGDHVEVLNPADDYRVGVAVRFRTIDEFGSDVVLNGWIDEIELVSVS